MKSFQQLKVLAPGLSRQAYLGMLEERSRACGRVNIIVFLLPLKKNYFHHILTFNIFPYLFLFSQATSVEIPFSGPSLNGHTQSMRWRGPWGWTHFSALHVFQRCMPLPWMAIGSTTISKMPQGITFSFIQYSKKIFIMYELYFIDFIYIISKRSNVGLFDGSFFANDEEVASFVQSIHTNTKHVS